MEISIPTKFRSFMNLLVSIQSRRITYENEWRAIQTIRQKVTLPRTDYIGKQSSTKWGSNFARPPTKPKS
ncbi:hypothetical protein GQ457_17G016180 [Hibiscus cannabinus]